jgi:hypothetical protein
VTGTVPDVPGTATPMNSPMVASGTGSTPAGRKPDVETGPDGAAEFSGAFSSDK